MVEAPSNNVLKLSINHCGFHIS